MIKGGIGGNRTLTGLKFESRIALRDVIGSLRGYSIKEDKIFFNNQKVAELFSKNKIYKNLLKPSKVDYSSIISKKLLPDDAILVEKEKTLFIVEIKFQEVAGSVDEKLQTCDFKNKQYVKLLSPIKIKVKYVYILNDWFKKKEYADVLEYITSSNCYFFFNELPLDFLGLPKPL